MAEVTGIDHIYISTPLGCAWTDARGVHRAVGHINAHRHIGADADFRASGRAHADLDAGANNHATHADAPIGACSNRNSHRVADSYTIADVDRPSTRRRCGFLIRGGCLSGRVPRCRG